MINSLFDPKSVAVIGATDREGSVGFGLCRNLLEGGKRRKIYFVNPNRSEVFSKKTYPSVLDIKEKVELAVIAVPAPVVEKVAREAAKKKVDAVIVISAGFSEAGKEGEKRQEIIAEIAREAGMSLAGPNCLGVIRPGAEFNATFAPATPRKGGIAFISQSGALIDSVIDRSLSSYYGFSGIASLGNMAGVTISDLLHFFKEDKETKSIILYLEGVKEGRDFMRALKEAAQVKPVAALKAGRSKKGGEAVSSHTGSLAGEAEVYSAVFKQTGVFEVKRITDLLNVGRVLAWQPRFEGKVGIVTNGGGAGVLAVDALSRLGVPLASLSEKTRKRLQASKVMHPDFSPENPLDIVGDARSERYEEAVSALLGDKEVGALLVIETLQIMTEPLKNAKILIEARKKYAQKPIIASFMGGKLSSKAAGLLEKNRIPNFFDPQEAALAIKSLRK